MILEQQHSTAILQRLKTGVKTKNVTIWNLYLKKLILER